MSDGNFDTLERISRESTGIVSPDAAVGDSSLFPLESRIISLALLKEYESDESESQETEQKEELRFNLLPWNSQVTSSSPLISIEFTESIYNTCMFGSMLVRDDRNWVDEFSFTGNEKVELEIKIGKSDVPVKFKFHIYDAKTISNEAQQVDYTSNDERISVWRLDFISSDIFLSNYNTTTLEIQEDFIGPLSGDEDFGLIENIFKKYKLKTNKIDPSRTGVWLRYDNAAYPWMKMKGQMRVTQLLKYLSNYAWDGNLTNYLADYYVWEDRDGWNFRSITNILFDGETNDLKSPDDGFLITVDPLNPNRILEFNVLNEYNIQGLFELGALASSYNRVDPNYSETYLDFLDSRESFKSRIFTYDYKKYKNDTILIEKYPLLSDDIEGKTLTSSNTLNYSTYTDDDIYGYFNKNFLNSPFSVDWEDYGRTLGGPWDIKAYQTQFDLTDMDVDTFKDIQLNIRNVLKHKRAEYARLKNIKRKWEAYRCTVCCHENGPLGSTMDIYNILNPGPTSGSTYALLFGPTGYYSMNRSEKYGVVAAGSFTDTLNYQAGVTLYERGLTYSYDLTKSPYAETLGQFFNLTGPTAPAAYTKYVIERATQQYQIIIDKVTERIDDLKDFVDVRVKEYKTTADNIFKSIQMTTVGEEQRPIVAPEPRPIDLLLGVNNRFLGDAIVGEQLTDSPITSYEFGMVPHSKVASNTGVKQVVFGTDPNAQPFIQFRNVSDGGVAEGNSPGGYCFTFNCIWCIGTCSNIGLQTPEGGQAACAERGGIWFDEDGCPGALDLVPDICSPGQCDGIGGGEGPEDAVCVRCLGNGQKECIEIDNPDDCPSDTFATNRYFCENYPDFFCGNGQEQERICAECLNNSISCRGPVSCDDETTDPNICCPAGGVPTRISQALCQASLPCFGLPGPQGPAGPTGPTGPAGPTGPSNLPSSKDVKYISKCSYVDCSRDRVIRGYIKHTTKNAVAEYSQIYVYAAPYLWDSEISDWSFYDYGSESGLIPGVVNTEIKIKTQQCLDSCGCYNTTCASSVALEVLRRTCVAEIQLLEVELELVKQLKEMVESQYKEIWSKSYTEWYNRNAFFFSKKPGASIFRTVERPTIQSPLSLQNIKSITRKEVRGSRYELLSRKIGVTGALTGQWLYNIFFAGVSGSTFHPYYDQKYAQNGFVTSRKPHVWFGLIDGDATDDPTYFIDEGKFTYQNQPVDSSPDYRGREYVEPTILHIGKIDAANDLSQSPFLSYGYAQSDLELTSNPTTLDNEDINYRNTFNFYNTNGKKPPNIKKEEISSYVRVEFANPIGLDTIKDFPNGFVRDAGVEYFLPYIVNLTPGPFGRQSVKYNVAVIGMDPFGFDVAVKKIKDDLPTNRKLQGIDKGNYYNWWNHDTGSVLSKSEYLTSDYNGMDLWPEVGFETEFPYYSYDAAQEDLHGGGYDMDFHMGGGYYFENESQNWMESLYHYGMSSNKQFDPLYRTSVVGSYILPNSYRKLKPHRSWWSFFVPRNLFVPVRFANMFKTPNTKARDLYGGRAVFALSPNYWRTWYGSEFENWVSLSKDGMQSLIEDKDIKFFIDGDDVIQGQTLRNTISVFTENSASDMNGYFRDSLMHYLAANYILYRPGLVATDLWKYDLSGESDYGLITPPVDTEYEFFDRNFAVQFVVHGKGMRTCEDLGLKCANPKAIKDGPVISAGGCTFDPYCNCPAKNLMPSEPEPTYLEIQRIYAQTNECNLIQETLGPEWLGCEFSDPTSSCSCNCPEQGERFKEYLEYTRTYSTFWNCPLDLPLRRQAQITQFAAQKIAIAIAPNNKVKIGSLVEVINSNDIPSQTKNAFKKISGKWFVSEINHIVSETKHKMRLTLVRNSLHYDPNEGAVPKYVLKPKKSNE